MSVLYIPLDVTCSHGNMTTTYEEGGGEERGTMFVVFINTIPNYI